MPIAHGLVYGLPWMRFTDVQPVLRKASVYGNRVRSVYGSVYGGNLTNKIFGASPPEDLTQKWLD